MPRLAKGKRQRAKGQANAKAQSLSRARSKGRKGTQRSPFEKNRLVWIGCRLGIGVLPSFAAPFDVAQDRLCGEVLSDLPGITGQINLEKAVSHEAA
jgi:hypothetical protein